jgi:hypothetical protein
MSPCKPFTGPGEFAINERSTWVWQHTLTTFPNCTPLQLADVDSILFTFVDERSNVVISGRQ